MKQNINIKTGSFLLHTLQSCVVHCNINLIDGSKKGLSHKKKKIERTSDLKGEKHRLPQERLKKCN